MRLIIASILAVLLFGSFGALASAQTVETGTATLTDTNYPGAIIPQTHTAVWGDHPQYGQFVMISGVLFTNLSGDCFVEIFGNQLYIYCPPYWGVFTLAY